MFDGATFINGSFGAVVFNRAAHFRTCTFNAEAKFSNATFKGWTDFDSAVFKSLAAFENVQFLDWSVFNKTTFLSHSRFNGVKFASIAQFDRAKFEGEVRFSEAVFDRGANFRFAMFSAEGWFDSISSAGSTVFGGAVFEGAMHFMLAGSVGDVSFIEANFWKYADFSGVTFQSKVDCEGAEFRDSVTFGWSTFEGEACFDRVSFQEAEFAKCVFAEGCSFQSAQFSKSADFDSVKCEGDANFASAVFVDVQHLGPICCSRNLLLDGSRFNSAQIVIEAACRVFLCEQAIFSGSASLRLRHAEVFLSGTVTTAPISLQTRQRPFEGAVGTLDEGDVTRFGTDCHASLRRLESFDAANLVLTDIDLSDCEFSGVFHLDQITLGSGCSFRQPPRRWHFRSALFPVRWARRKTIAEEHHWRALEGGQSRALIAEWARGPHHFESELAAGPNDISEIYQQLRKAFEDSGDEPDAADFYYGEMEMRRHDPLRQRSERLLIWVYWLVSGYGLRASRALAWLAASAMTTVILLLAFGLPDGDSTALTTGTSRSGYVALETSTPDPALAGPLRKRFTEDRAEKAALVVVNSVVFRSSGQNLTRVGTIIEMSSRIGEPVLLGLAALAIRGRLKR